MPDEISNHQGVRFDESGAIISNKQSEWKGKEDKDWIFNQIISDDLTEMQILFD